MSRALLAALALPLLAGGRALGAQPARDASADSAVVATVQRAGCAPSPLGPP